jgi:hypothetical protein
MFQAHMKREEIVYDFAFPKNENVICLTSVRCRNGARF